MIDIKFTWRGLKTRYRDQIQELQSIKSALSEGGISIDIGSNKGSYLYSMAKWAKGSPVIAFEPQKKLAQYLKNVCLRNGFTNVIVENLAVSNHSGALKLFVPGESDSPGASLEQGIAEKTQCHIETVQTITLDTYVLNRIKQPIKVIKIDVEGHESSVIKGAKQTIERDHPLLIIECEARHMPPKSTVISFIETVEKLGYIGSLVISKKNELPANQFKECVHQKQIGDRFWDSKEYYNNFIFRPKK